MTTTTLIRIPVRAIAILALASAWAVAAEPAAKPGAAAQKKKDDAPVIFTNKSLDQLPPPPPPTSLDHVAAAPAAAADSGAGADGALTITNETLEKLFGKSEPPPPPAEPAKPAAGTADAGAPPTLDPLAAMQKEKEDAAKRQEEQASAQKDLATAEANVRDLEKRLLADHNPLLPRPALTPEEQAKVSTLDNAARAQRTQEQLDLAKKELERAREQAGQSSPQR